MKTSPLFTIGLLCALTGTAIPQSPHHFPNPPQSMDPDTQNQAPAAHNRHINLDHVQRDADDLARTAQSIPGDIASVRQGMLPKDVIEKLKQIEKLSKRLRTELNP